jgi:hypothetical protein
MNFFHKTKIVDGYTLRQSLDEIISPRLAKCTLFWNEKYLWFNQPQNSIRQVFGYSILKGGRGTFVWGVCLDFVPTITSNKLRFHRTDKSVTQHSFEWTDEYSDSFMGGHLDGGITTHWGKQATKNSIQYLLDKYETKIHDWLNKTSTFENLIAIAEQQIKIGNSYNLHNPDQRMVLAFLLAKTNQLDNATKTINALTLDDNLRQLLLKQISKTS